MSKFFSPSHEWVKVEGNLGTVGISDYAQKELGEIVYLQLPKLNQVIQAGQEACVLESTKAAADVYSPVSGTVIAVNEAAIKEPGLVNRFPESSGWLYRMILSNPEEIQQLASTDF